MFSLSKYIMVLVAGVGIGYWFGLTSSQPKTSVPLHTEPAAPSGTASLQGNQPEQPVAQAKVAAPADKALRQHNPVADDDLNPPDEPDPFEEIAELEKAPVDPSWSKFLQQHYDVATQKILMFQTARNKQQIKDFQQSEVDHNWAGLTEQKLQDFYFLQPDQQFIQTTKIHCRQNGCEISGIVSKKGLLNQIQEELRDLPWAQGQSFSFSTTVGGQGQEKFYMLMLDLPKD